MRESAFCVGGGNAVAGDSCSRLRGTFSRLADGGPKVVLRAERQPRLRRGREQDHLLGPAQLAQPLGVGGGWGVGGESRACSRECGCRFLYRARPAPTSPHPPLPAGRQRASCPGRRSAARSRCAAGQPRPAGAGRDGSAVSACPRGRRRHTHARRRARPPACARPARTRGERAHALLKVTQWRGHRPPRTGASDAAFGTSFSSVERVMYRTCRRRSGSTERDRVRERGRERERE